MYIYIQIHIYICMVNPGLTRVLSRFFSDIRERHTSAYSRRIN